MFSTTIDLTMIMGLLAGTMTTIAFLPQLIQTWKTRSAKDVSLGMFLIFTTGVLLWVIYGLMIQSLPIIAANTVTLVLAGTILVLKLRYG